MIKQMAAGVLLAASAYAGGTNYVATAINSTNNATALVVAADSTNPNRRVMLRADADAYLAVGQEIATNAAVLSNTPVVLANTWMNFAAGGSFADAVYVRGTNSATTPKVSVIILWQ